MILEVAEDVEHQLQVGAEVLHEVDVLPLQVLHDDLPLQHHVEAVQQLERRVDRRAVLEALRHDRAQPLLQLLNLDAEDVKVIVERLGLHVEQVVLDLQEALEGLLEVGVDLLDGGGEDAALGAANLDSLEAAELQHGLAELEDIVAALQEAVEPHEQRRVLEAPRVVRALDEDARLVPEVHGLHRAAHLERHRQPVHGVLRLVLQDRLRLQELVRLTDQVVADLAHQQHQPRGGVVVVGVLPDEQDAVHDQHERLVQRLKLVRVGQPVQVRFERRQELDVLVGLGRRDLHRLAELEEGRGVGGADALQHLDDLLDARPLQLLADRVEVVRLVLPVRHLDVRPDMLAGLQLLLGIGLQDVLDLARPRDDGRLELVGALLLVHQRRGLRGRQRQRRRAILLTDRCGDIGNRQVEVAHDLLGQGLGPALRQSRLRHERQVHRVRHDVKVLQRRHAEVAAKDIRAHVIHRLQLAPRRLDEPHRLCVLLVPARGWHTGLRETATGVDSGKRANGQPPFRRRGKIYRGG